MPVTSRRGGRSLAVHAVPFLDRWSAEQPFTAHLHSGDLGWHLRFDDDAVDGSIRCWDADGATVAVGLVDSGVLRLAVAPGWSSSTELSTAVREEADGLDYVDAPSGTELRSTLLRDGWSADPDPWVLLYKELDETDAAYDDPGSRTLSGPSDVAARVDVQRSAFSPGSTFSSELWQRAADGPSYDPRFEMVTWTPDGRPAAAATGWFAGLGRPAILEPVGTHRDHQRQGYGRRVNLAVMAALARAGASAIRVHTPASNEAAVGAYESCGLRQVDWTTSVMRG
jgi:GNAT superfamily N-acetyltransferase